MMRRGVAAGILVACAAAGAIAVGVAGRDGATIRPAVDAEQASTAVADAAASGERLPDVAVRDDRGNEINLRMIAGPAVIHVFASWCPTCQGEAPTFTEVQRGHPDLDYYYLNVDDGREDAKRFIARYGWRDGPVLSDPDRRVASTLGLVGQPHTVFVAVDGSIVRHIGPGSFEELDALARAVGEERDAAR